MSRPVLVAALGVAAALAFVAVRRRRASSAPARAADGSIAPGAASTALGAQVGGALAAGVARQVTGTFDAQGRIVVQGARGATPVTGYSREARAASRAPQPCQRAHRVSRFRNVDHPEYGHTFCCMDPRMPAKCAREYEGNASLTRWLRTGHDCDPARYGVGDVLLRAPGTGAPICEEFGQK